MKTDINLASGALVESVSKSKTLGILRIAGISSIIFITVISILLFVLINQVSPDNVKKQKDKFLHDKEVKIASINSKIVDISGILDSRINYDSEFSTFLEKIPNGITINSLEIDKAKVAVTVSSNSLSLIDEMLNNFFEMIAKKQIIKNVTIQNISSDQGGGNYSLSMKANKL